LIGTLGYLVALFLLRTTVAYGAQAAQAPQQVYTGISVEPNPELFATLCALDAAGFAADESTLAEMPSRLALREDLLKMQGPATEAVRAFYRDHLLSDPGETLSRYITFALVIGPPPRFQYQVEHDQLPPDVLALEGFQQILAAFYQEARLEARWRSVEPEYARLVARYQPPVRRIVVNANAYLRELIKPKYGRTFIVYVEPLVGNRTNFRNHGDQYAIVMGRGSQASIDQIQHAYLHFMLDQLPLRYRKQVEAKKPLLQIAARAPRLPVEYHSDFLSYADECLIKAVELRLRHLSQPQLDAALAEADLSGFVLVRPLVQQLQKFEKAEPAMTYYFPDLIAGIDVEAEQKRLQNIAFVAPKPAAESEQTDATAPPPSDLDRALAEGDHEIAVMDVAAAAATFEKILTEYPEEPRAVYGLAIASVLGGKGDRAKTLFLKLTSPGEAPGSNSESSREPLDPKIVAWSHVYLGRIHDLEDEREQAVVEYRAALSVDGAPEAARVAAQRGVDSAYQPRARDNNDSGKGSQPQNP
jgi:hypothetical protein